VSLCDCLKRIVSDEKGLFSSLDIQPDVMHIAWRNQTDRWDFGEIWIATSNDGLHWVSDGYERIAALPARIFRFFRSGIAVRRNSLVNSYLQEMVTVGPGDTVVNIGANIGEIAITLAEQGAAVIAIEPDPNVLPLLGANAFGRNIEIVPASAWNTDGAIKMYLASDSADTSVFNVSEHEAMVNSRRIDTLMQERGIERVRLIIGDVEGAEPEALEGARETLKTTDYVSIRASAERAGESTLEACEAILGQAGFDIIYREETGFCTLIAEAKTV
jgi:FkbM family methyltransferase